MAPDSAPIVEGHFDVGNDVELFYRKFGDDGDIVIFLHGGPGADMDNGGLDLEPVANGRTLILYDQRGCGRSTLVSEDELLTVARHIHDLEMLRRHFEIERMTLMGLSWGAGLAALYAEQYPAHVERLILLSPMPPAKIPYWDQRLAQLNAVFHGWLDQIRAIEASYAGATDTELVALCQERSRLLLGAYVFDQAAIEHRRGFRCHKPPAAIRNEARVSAATLRSLSDWDFRPFLATLQVPTLVVEGEKTHVPLDPTRLWASLMPNSRLLLITGAGHLPFLEKPSLFFPALERFLAGSWPENSEQVVAG
jgi:proline iminopeptidase